MVNILFCFFFFFSGDASSIAQVKNFLSSGETMRQQALIHASVPCAPLDNLYMEASYEVETTGAIVNLSSSVSLLNFYCSRLPSDGCVSRHRLLFFPSMVMMMITYAIVVQVFQANSQVCY